VEKVSRAVGAGSMGFGLEGPAEGKGVGVDRKVVPEKASAEVGYCSRVG